MPRKRRYDKNFNESGKVNIDAQRRQYWEQSAAGSKVGYDVAVNPDLVGPSLSTPDQVAEHHSILWLLGEICADAYLRIVPDGGLGMNHWFIKYTRGQWAGHYLYFAQRPYDPIPMAIATLARRYHEVYAGSRKPTKDSAFGHGGSEATGL